VEVAPPPDERAAPASDAAVPTCPHCGSPYEPLQEYCLECGSRLPVEDTSFVALSTAWRSRVPWYPGDWVWPTIVLLGVAALGGAVAYFATQGEQTTSVVIATTARGSAAPSTAQVTATTPTTPATTAVTTAPATTGAAPTTPARGSSALTTWPTGRSGYTTVLQSLPAARGRKAAGAYSRRALRKGLTDVGFLDSAEFSSLHPGYYVVFSGIYSSVGAARSNAATAVAAGFRAAYARQITP